MIFSQEKNITEEKNKKAPLDILGVCELEKMMLYIFSHLLVEEKSEKCEDKKSTRKSDDKKTIEKNNPKIIVNNIL